MKNKVDTKTWQDFNISDLFEIKGTITTPLLELQECGVGKFPFVTTKATNNAIEGYYNFWTEKGGVLTVDSAVLGFCSYQDVNFSASDHVEKLTPKFNMTKNIAMFLVTIMNHEQYRYNYGRKANQKRLKSSSIKLPAKNGKPDWVFIEEFINTHTNDYSYAKKPALKLPTPKLDMDSWRYYQVSDLFNVVLSKGDNKPSKLNNGDTPLVSSGFVNNGVVKMIESGDEKSQLFQKNTITFDMFGTVFTQPNDFYAVSHGRVNMLVPKQKMTSEVLLFCTSILNKEKYRFNYGRAAYSNVVKKLKIKLPTKDNRPDYSFMEKFIQTLPFSSQVA